MRGQYPCADRVPSIRQTFQTGGSFQLIPTYLILSRQQDGGPGLFAPLKKGRTETKGKNRALPDEEEWFNDPIVVQGGPNYHDPSGYVELRREKKQMLALISKLDLCRQPVLTLTGKEKETKAAEAAAAKAAEEKEAASAKAKEEAILSGNAAECGCCFDMEPLVSRARESELTIVRDGVLRRGPLILQNLRQESS